MKHILIIVAISLANPQEKTILAHKAYATYGECMEAGALATANVPKELKVSGFCISEEDLLETKQVS